MTMLNKLKCVVINTEKTIFWRYQTKKSDENLSTIEAMYFFLRDYDKVMSDSDSEGNLQSHLAFCATYLSNIL